MGAGPEWALRNVGAATKVNGTGRFHALILAAASDLALRELVRVVGSERPLEQAPDIRVVLR
ncbi:MAG TPA: hypothetical protein VKM54_25940 [Myxococcota bacterium]|nr:hypothetical protein [Myxococcota bacterium]